MSPSTRNQPDEARHLCIIRHAAAGSRSRWTAPDSLRPLTRKGGDQALALAQRYRRGCEEIYSSPYVRCLETVAPLSNASSVDVEETEYLAEGADPTDAFDWLVAKAIGVHPKRWVIACTHGDLMLGFVEILSALGISELTRVMAQKAGAIEIDLSEGKVAAARYLVPPKTPDRSSLGRT